MRRGQTSVEFLILLAIIVSLTLLIVSSLGLFPSIGKSFESQQIRQYWQSEDIGLVSYDINTSHIRLFVLNNFDDSIKIEKIYVDSVNASSPAVELSSGESVLLNFSHSLNISSGDPYSVELRFDYTNLEDSQLYSLYGLSPIIGIVS